MRERSDIEITSLSAIEHLLQHRPEQIKLLKIPRSPEGRLADMEMMAKEAGIRVDYQLPKGKQESAAAVLGPFAYADLAETIEALEEEPTAFIVALDHLQDPQNLGAICRTAEGLGAAAVLLPRDRSVGVGAGAYHASVGAVGTLPVVSVANLGEALRKLKDQGYWVVGSTLGPEAKAPDTVPDFKKMVLILGAEGEGMGPALEKICDWLVQIPLAGQVQSLNVSAAGAILIYELLRRQRG